MMNTNKKTPKLRFKGFSDDWEQCKLDDIAKIKTGGGTPKTAKPEYWSGNIPWIQSSDLVEGDITHVNINKFINNNALKNSAAKLISRDSIALVTRVGVGKVAVINQDFTTSQDFLSLSDFDRSDIKFLAYQLYRLMQENAKVLQGTSIKGITKTELIEQSISIPNSGQEQHLISNVLSKIDSIITLHQCKLEKLKLTKKALLQKLFPKNGKRIPEIRFKGFTDAWEQRNLESLFTKYEDKVKTPNSGYWRLGLRSHCKGTFHTYVDAGNELETAEMNRVQSGNFILNITFAWERALAVTNEEDQDKLVSHRFPQFKPNSDLAIDFFKHTLIDKRFKHHLELSSPGGAGRNKVLKIADMLKYELLVPSIKEQNEISSFLNNVDYIITLYQRKLDRLISIKKALLQQLFV
ncbi:MAG: restriction endonuclease subunit S [Veillonella sp.]|nr:restriction endonuclease subunit S [Veillonella sp.]